MLPLSAVSVIVSEEVCVVLLRSGVAADAVVVTHFAAADRDLLHMAQGQSHPQKLFNIGRVSLKSAQTHGYS